MCCCFLPARLVSASTYLFFRNMCFCLSLPTFCLFTWMLHIGVKRGRRRHRRFFFFFLMDLFTAAASITAFVVVIKFLLPQPRIIIAGSHLASVNHLLFPPGFLHLQLRTSFLTEVHSCASLNTLGSYFISVQKGLRSSQNNKTFVLFFFNKTNFAGMCFGCSVRCYFGEEGVQNSNLVKHFYYNLISVIQKWCTLM